MSYQGSPYSSAYHHDEFDFEDDKYHDYENDRENDEPHDESDEGKKLALSFFTIYSIDLVLSFLQLFLHGDSALSIPDFNLKLPNIVIKYFLH